MKLTKVEGSVTYPKGFLAAGVFADIKRLGTGKGSAKKARKRDLGLIVSECPASAAGLFTTNQVCAAPVKVSRKYIATGIAQAIVANSGNANACTGTEGMSNAVAMTRLTGEVLNLPTNKVLVCSTGRIGVQLPMKNVASGITAAAQLLNETRENAAHVAEAIMTSDSRPKEIAVKLRLGGSEVRIGGICKGAGMIQPGMSVTGQRPPATPLHATMLSMITTDAAISPRVLQKALEDAVALSFNRITVDGDMSTNDTVLILANGLAGNKKISASSGKDFSLFLEALRHVALELAKMIVRDGEGVSRFVTVRLKGARNFHDADAAARAVANSALVKTSWCGGDPNWGRILDALGYSSAKVIEERVSVGYSRPGSAKILYALRQGQPTKTALEKLRPVVKEKEFDLHIDLQLGKAETIIYGADLTEEYVDFNKGE